MSSRQKQLPSLSTELQDGSQRDIHFLTLNRRSIKFRRRDTILALLPTGVHIHCQVVLQRRPSPSSSCLSYEPYSHLESRVLETSGHSGRTKNATLEHCATWTIRSLISGPSSLVMNIQLRKLRLYYGIRSPIVRQTSVCYEVCYISVSWACTYISVNSCRLPKQA